MYNVKRGKWDKIPVSPSNADYGLSTNKPERWVPFAVALVSLTGKTAGLGFVMTRLRGYIAIDLDNCLGEPWALEIIDLIGSYTEISPSGKGYRIFMLGELAHDWTNHERGIEVYAGNEARFLTVTGDHVPGTPKDLVAVESRRLDALAVQYAKEKRRPVALDAEMPEILDVMD